MSGNISEASASLSSNSDIVPDMDVELPRSNRKEGPKAALRNIIGRWPHQRPHLWPHQWPHLRPHPNDDDEGENDCNDDDEGENDTNSKRKEEEDNVPVYQRKEEEDKTIKTTFLVATLIATVTFAAGFTLPGGTIQDGENQGSPILKHNLAFQIFVITDCTALVLSASAVLIYLFTTVDEVRKNKKRYMSYGMVATRLTMLAMVSMMIAFLAGTYAVLGVGDSNSIGVVTLLIGLSFFLILGILVCKSDKYIREK